MQGRKKYPEDIEVEAELRLRAAQWLVQHSKDTGEATAALTLPIKLLSALVPPNGDCIITWIKMFNVKILNGRQHHYPEDDITWHHTTTTTTQNGSLEKTKEYEGAHELCKAGVFGTHEI
ncbi:hypothetical protein E2C01_019996 [Portunus trituberculatus]|uniref:Uncharacterized protein n=1 Tax=Portunus trituberculatus TaxID=210409 RepID=A0A5B7E048_PORTR|nr:hypothetical protein [Portunus trituberculatus]